MAVGGHTAAELTVPAPSPASANAMTAARSFNILISFATDFRFV